MDNIVAIATAQGYAGIGIVRISGKELYPIAQQLITPHSQQKADIQPQQAHYCTFYDQNGTAIDMGLILYFKAPNSFTGEDVIEIQAHGSPVVLQTLVKRCIELGCRHAEAGEFSRRAYLNGKMDLLQAESIVDLIHAESEASAKGAIQSLKGTFSKHITTLNKKLIDLRMFIEASIDFPEEDIDFIANAKIKDKLLVIQDDIKNILSQTKQGVLLNNGANVVIVGQPNVGKSSLLNILANEEIAIVTDVAGTTRDIVKEKIIINGILFNILDTAGIRDTQDKVEQIGITKAIDSIKNADLCLILIDATNGITANDKDILKQIPDNIPHIFVSNKVDLLPDFASNNLDVTNKASGDQSNKSMYTHESLPNSVNVNISAKHNIGIDNLRNTMLTSVGYQSNNQEVFVARERHLAAIKDAIQHIDYGFNNWHNLELLAEEIRYAHNQLSTITGEFTSDDLLGEIFSKFCIGK